MNKSGIIWLAVGAVVIIGLFLVLRPRPTIAPVSEPTASPNATRAASPTLAPTPAADIFVFSVKQGKVTAPEKFSTIQGREVVIQVTADVSDEIHLHGYNVSKAVAAGQTAELRFAAETAGRFELELEQRKQALGFLEVLPK